MKKRKIQVIRIHTVSLRAVFFCCNLTSRKIVYKVSKKVTPEVSVISQPGGIRKEFLGGDVQLGPWNP